MSRYRKKGNNKPNVNFKEFIVELALIARKPFLIIIFYVIISFIFKIF